MLTIVTTGNWHKKCLNLEFFFMFNHRDLYVRKLIIFILFNLSAFVFFLLLFRGLPAVLTVTQRNKVNSGWLQKHEKAHPSTFFLSSVWATAVTLKSGYEIHFYNKTSTSISVCKILGFWFGVHVAKKLSFMLCKFFFCIYPTPFPTSKPS